MNGYKNESVCLNVPWKFSVKETREEEELGTEPFRLRSYSYREGVHILATL